MAKIGIVSRIHGINYGANLQAYALQKTLESLGNTVEYINFKVDIRNKGFRGVLSTTYNLIKYFFGYYIRKKRTLLFRTNISFSEAVKKVEDLAALDCKYDIVMCGSDQIWNPRYYLSSEGLYLLLHSAQKKVSYASSFGVNILPEEYKAIVKDALGQFSNLSTRESSGVTILKEIGLKSERHIDPTFLLSADEWNSLSPTEAIITEKYICCYVMPGVNDLNDYIISVARRIKSTHKDIKRIIVLGEREYKKLLSPSEYFTSPGPQDFINIIANATMVLTSSFHGTCFSIIYNKPFFSVLDPKNNFNTRITDLLSIFHIQNRILWLNSEITDIDMPKIDYSLINEIVKKEKERSYNYLKEITK